jgi:hypothetical protein
MADGFQRLYGDELRVAGAYPDAVKNPPFIALSFHY